MLTIYNSADGRLSRADSPNAIGENTVWIDLLNPTPEEDTCVEKALGISVPTRDEMREIEASNRLYTEHGSYYMTGFVVYNIETGVPTGTAITFILSGNRLITVRYADPKAFPQFLQRVDKGEASCATASALMVGLIESIIHRKADLIEHIQDDIDKLALSLFEVNDTVRKRRERRLDTYLKKTGKEGDIVARVQESAMSFDRLLLYLSDAARTRKDDPDVLNRIEVAHRDIGALLENMRFLSSRMNFLLDATLGMISTEQNQIIKLFSVMAVMLMPPTLVASIYGMNFKFMPELDWPIGYPLALLLMVVAAVIPYFYFRRKGWL
jgi:magnesium transporter